MGYTAVGEIPGIVAGLRETYTSGATRPLEWRRRQLKAMRLMMKENEEAMLDALKKDLHRSRFAALAMELWDVVGQVGYLLDNLDKFTKTEALSTPLALKPLSFEAWKEPYGVVVVIAPWNFPIGLGLNPLAGALAAGNACVFKPSEVSVATNQLFEELIPKYFEPSALAIVSGGVEQTTELLAQKVDNIMYTGGGTVARIVMAAAAKNLTPVTLELGGKCPAYVDESANLEVTARRLLFGKNINSGQICIAPDYALVHHKVRDSLLEHLKTQHAKMFPGAEQESDDKGRIINDNHFRRVKGLLQGHGGKVVLGGETDEADRFVAFTIVTDPSPDSPLMQEEIFGPIFPVVTVQSIEEAIAYAGQRPTPLAAYVFERDPAVSKKWLAEVPSGGACVNDCMMHIANNDGGFGGKGESGMGSYRGRFSFDTFTHRKVVARQAANFDPESKYPPYDSIPPILKMLVTQQFPGWVKPVFWAVVWGAVAGLALLARKHISFSLQVSLK